MWLHVPNLEQASPSAEGSSGSTWESGWFCRPFALWVLSSGKPTQLPSSLLEWRKVPWIALLYSTISRPSTAERGAAAWISSLRGSLAREIPSPADEPALTTSAGSGERSGESFARLELDTSSSRTFPVCSPLPETLSAKSSGRWPRAGGLRNGTTFQRQPSAPRTSAIVSSCSLPTPAASDYGSSQNGINGKGGENERPSAGRPPPSSAARMGMLPTPTTRPENHVAGRDGPTLVEAVNMMGGRLPTPVARDHKGTGRTGQLPTAIAQLAMRGMLPTPTASDSKASGVAGNWTKGSGRNAGATLTDVVVRKIDTQTHMPGSATDVERDSPTSSSPGEPTGIGAGHLSPFFVMWMMAAPPGWLDWNPLPSGDTSDISSTESP